jgi:hypothetical protein
MLAAIFGLLGLLAYAALVGYIAWGYWKGGVWLMTWIARRREVRIAHIEADLDRKQDELRSTLLQLADALGMEAHEARKALIRESYRASGRLPDRK